MERTIQYVRHSFFAARPFTTLEDFNRQALAWRDQIAHQRPWPGDDSRTVAEVFAEEKARLLPLPLHPFSCDLVKTVRADKTLCVRFDLNDYSLPPQARNRPLTLVASPTTVRLLDGSTEVATHPRSYDRHELVEDPAHRQALLEQKRKALGSTPSGRLAVMVPESQAFLQAAFEHGESTPGSPFSSFACSMTMGLRNSPPPSARPSNSRPRALLPWPLFWPVVIASSDAAPRCPSTSRAVPIWKT